MTSQQTADTPIDAPSIGAAPIDTGLIKETVALACGVMEPTRILPSDTRLAELESLLRGHVQLLIGELDLVLDDVAADWPGARVAVASARVALDGGCGPGAHDGGLHSAVRLRVLGMACAALLAVYAQVGGVR